MSSIQWTNHDCFRIYIFYQIEFDSLLVECGICFLFAYVSRITKNETHICIFACDFNFHYCQSCLQHCSTLHFARIPQMLNVGRCLRWHRILDVNILCLLPSSFVGWELDLPEQKRCQQEGENKALRLAPSLFLSLFISLFFFPSCRVNFCYHTPLSGLPPFS